MRCVALADGPFKPGVCVWQDGDASCPAGYSNRYRLAEQYQDNRGCEPCVCDSLVGGSCDVVAHLYDSPSCTQGIEVTDDSCEGPHGPATVSGLDVSSTWETDGKGAVCGSPSGGNVTGELKPTGGITVCGAGY